MPAQRTLAPLALLLTAGWSAGAAAAPTEPGDLTNPLEQAVECQGCHLFPNLPDRAAEPPYAPWAWAGSIMGNAARDPVFWAGVAIAHQDEPGSTVECVRCHSPRAFLEGRGGAIAMDELNPEDLASVECDLCHRMIDDGITEAGDAHYVIDDMADMASGQVPKRGPWDYQGGDTPAHPWQPDEYLGTSRFCGTCHDVTIPRDRVDMSGAPVGALFNEQRTYSEWLGSDFAEPGSGFRSCQDCHMAAVADVAGCGTFSGQISHPEGGRRHDLAGSNAFMLGIMKDLYGSAGTDEVPDGFYDNAIARTLETASAAASFEIDAPDQIDASQAWSLGVRVINETGHKLPSGYSEGRIAWVEVVARYQDQVIWSSGRWEDGTGFEMDSQLRTYEGVAEDADDGTRLHLVRNNRWVSDTRIPPRGLQPDLETDPVGDRYVVQADGTWPHFDDVDYAFDPTTIEDGTPDDDADDELELTVRLLYLINTPEYVAFLEAENLTNGAGSHVATLFEERGGSTPTVLGETSVVIPLSGLGGDAETGGTGSSSGDAGTATDDDSTSTGDGDPTASTTASGSGTGDAGSGSSTGSDSAGENGGDPDGCSCRAGSTSGAPTLGWLLLGALGAGYRRRRWTPAR